MAIHWYSSPRGAPHDVHDYIFEPANAREHPLPAGADPAEHTPEAVVERIAKSGAICVKISLEDGFGDRSDWPLMSVGNPAARARGYAEARPAALVHANALDMQRIAINGNVDLLVHGVWNWNEVDGQPGMPAVIATHLRNITTRTLATRPRCACCPASLTCSTRGCSTIPMYAKVVPPRLLFWYRTEPAQWFKREVFGPERGCGRGDSRPARGE